MSQGQVHMSPGQTHMSLGPAYMSQDTSDPIFPAPDRKLYISDEDTIGGQLGGS